MPPAWMNSRAAYSAYSPPPGASICKIPGEQPCQLVHGQLHLRQPGQLRGPSHPPASAARWHCPKRRRNGCFGLPNPGAPAPGPVSGPASAGAADFLQCLGHGRFPGAHPLQLTAFKLTAAYGVFRVNGAGAIAGCETPGRVGSRAAGRRTAARGRRVPPGHGKDHPVAAQAACQAERVGERFHGGGFNPTAARRSAAFSAPGRWPRQWPSPPRGARFVFWPPQSAAGCWS